MPRIPHQPSDASKPYDQVAHMEYLIHHYSRPSWVSLSAHDHQEPRPTSILLTGTTGNLGSYILALLIADPKVARIYALNRSSARGPAVERIAAQFQKKGLDVTALRSDKVSFIEGDTTKSDLGIDACLYNEIRDSITLILHNAWPINLRNDLAYFEPQLVGLQHLIDLGHGSPHSSNLRFIFISSFQAFQSWHMHYDALLPEEVITETAVGCGMGYGASKYVAESILSRSGLNSTSIRFTQLCGRSSVDYWSPLEWIPILMSAGVQLGVLPDIAGLMACVPMDDAAKCVHDIVSCERSLPAVLNVSHPRPIHWNTLFATINNVLQERRNLDPLPTTPFSKWLSLVTGSAHLAKIKHPSLKLIPSATEGLSTANEAAIRLGRQDIDHLPKPHLSIDAAQSYSSSLRDLKPITPEEVRGWVEYVLSMIPNL